MSGEIFISDLHLHESRPHITQLFIRFLKKEAVNASALYILGDLFEFWVGDDNPDSHDRHVVNHLKNFSQSGTPLYIMHGNRDFLMGKQFAHDTGCQILEDPDIIRIDNQDILLMHGDLLCTDDTQYQKFRQEVRTRQWRDRVLSMPLADRLAWFQSLREDSRQSIQHKAAEIMDVNQNAVVRYMQDYHVDLLIHGHTHRPAIHHFQLDKTPATRIVLGDWYNQGSVLYLDDGFHLETLTVQVASE